VTIAIQVHRAGGATRAWRIADPDAKLSWRAALPGASGYDLAVQVLRALGARGAEALDLLPLAMPASWMVNARASSRAFRRWRERPAREAWAVLLSRLGPMTSLEEWLALGAPARAEVDESARVLASGEEGASLVAVTKVLALLRPQLVPLMDDAAIALARGTVAVPESADDPRAPASELVPMLDWFAESVLGAEGALVEIAVRHEAAVLDAAQVLDRLLWFDSWGHRSARGYRVVDDAEAYSVVRG